MKHLTGEDHGLGGLEAWQRLDRLLEQVPSVAHPRAARAFHASDDIAHLPSAQLPCGHWLWRQDAHLQ